VKDVWKPRQLSEYRTTSPPAGKPASRSINEVKDANRCELDITSQPPGTMEWE
jgi:GMP synthase PP-ATPase subunit